MKGVSKTLLACLAIVLLGLSLSACGGDSNDSTGGSSPATQAPAESGGSGSGKAKEGAPAQSQDESGDSAQSSDDATATGEGSDAFITRGGDNSIQTFGEEGDDSDLEGANDVLVAYLDARADADWKAACANLAAAAIAPLEQLAARAPQLKGKGCAALLGSLLASGSPSTRANTMTEGIASLRVEDERGFALFHGAEGVDYFVPMVEEDGEWKVGALAPSEFP